MRLAREYGSTGAQRLVRSLCVVLLSCWFGAGWAAAEEATDPHADFDRFLKRHVDAFGRIDYGAAKGDSADLDRYVAWVSEVSPDNRADLFPTREDRLAYWINAYNAWVIRKVLDRYPIDTVKDVRPPMALFFLPRLSGFFVFEKIRLGGDRTSFRALENGIVRKRFGDPRVHFALNCASLGCPRLPTRAFTPMGLESELQRETLRFLSDPEKVRVYRSDGQKSRLFLSSIFKWYERDYTDWMKREHPHEPATIQGYLAVQLPGSQEVLDCRDCQVEFVDYDWTLNDRRDQSD